MGRLLDGGLDVNALTETGHKDSRMGQPIRTTALIQAVGHEQMAAAQLLLERGADPNLAASEGMTPLMTAAIPDSLPVLRLLIEAKAELNAVDPNTGSTAFHVTCGLKGSADSAEALVRWRHPTRGYLSPDTFIPLAEESDRIGELTLFVLRRALDDLAQWSARGTVIRTAVNISARLIASAQFVGQVERMIRADGIAPDRLIFEITESATLRDPAGARAALMRWCDLGVAISMDDYGTGQSTLSYLKNLPLSELKIDRSFVQHAHQDRSDALLVRSTVELAHQLGLKVVAEGIEEAECLAYLRAIGCDYAQGYFIGKPMAGDDLLVAIEEIARAAA